MLEEKRKLMKKTYICGPVSGYSENEVRARFDAVARALESKGIRPISPLENGLDWDAPWEEHMKESLKMMLDCDSVYVMRGWEQSRGCNLEVKIATALKLSLSFASEKGSVSSACEAG